ncbi:cell wall-binding repeat-containing protein [Peptostreptococcus porci]|uniref:cell wall-binding repeat-containing protein n=1 Tax=Peptostreptococcus porci TaxID=2652282 RepID=UPI002A91D3E5|nr:cell wall-binding repeat-containing protein [Peptostreptococcus porci]MDY6232899.1 cell wall-binding repeat-containing protein [Peptostreptococcus porci]
MKKQLAVLMAAATAVTTVAPVVANAATINTSRADALAKVQEALKVRYTDPAVTGLKGVLVTNGKEYLNSVYKFAAKVDGKYVQVLNSTVSEFSGNVKADDYVGLSLSDIETILDDAALKGKEVTIEKYNKGHKVDGDKIFANQYATFQRYTLKNDDDQQSIKYMVTKALYRGLEAPDYLAALNYNGNDYELKMLGDKKVLALKGVNTVTKDNAVALTQDDATSTGAPMIDLSKVLKLKLQSDAEIVINTNENFVLNFQAAVDKDGKVHNLFAQNAGNGYADKIVNFGKVETADGSASSYDIATHPEVIDTYIVQQYNAVFNVKDIYTVADGYTAKGAEFVNNMIDAIAEPIIKDGKLNPNAKEFNFDGKRYIVSVDKKSVENAKLVKEGDKAVFYVTADVIAKNDIETMGSTVAKIEKKITKQVIRVEADSELEASTVQRDIANGKKVVAKRRNVLAGADRFKTAIEISKESFADNGKAGEANAVVLVGQYSTVDGLAAAPFAKKVNAPILLSQFDKIDADTIAEIKRLIGKNAAEKVYIVGGEKTISKAVEKQLIDELNIRSERIEGKDRFETSRKLSDQLLSRIDTRKLEKIFTVGAEAEPDAMSASAVAARDEAPIVVVPKTQLDTDSKVYLNKIADGAKTIYLVGGVNSASEQVRKDLVALTKVGESRVKRVAGADRQETNAAVINEFYGKADGLFVAKSDTKSLVDALAAGPLAGAKKFPIVLATNALTDSQKMAVRNHVVNYKTQASKGYANVYEIGMGINSAVMSAIYNILGL